MYGTFATYLHTLFCNALGFIMQKGCQTVSSTSQKLFNTSDI